MAAAAAAVAGLSAAARRVAWGLRHSAPPRAARRGSVVIGETTPTAAFTRPLLPHVLRRGLAVAPGEGDQSLGADPDIFDPDDPEAPDDPETCFAYDDKDLESEESVWAMYERWCVFHGVKRDREDMRRRFSHFHGRARYIHEFNKSGKSWTMGLDRFGDWTPEEFARLFPPKLWRPRAYQCSVCLEKNSQSN